MYWTKNINNVINKFVKTFIQLFFNQILIKYGYMIIWERNIIYEQTEIGGNDKNIKWKKPIKSIDSK